jgi:hypothetical protein
MGRNNGAGSEDIIWRTLSRQLLPGETLLRNVRFSDPKNGDVEADFIVLMPDAGVAVIEVKGGTVTYEDGTWHMRNGDYARRIQPTEQGRRAKHALRRYLDRQPEWTHGLIRSAWFVALPFTEVTGDMGPEGKREQLIGSDDLGQIRDRIRAVLLNPLNGDPLPADDWVEQAVSLLLRLEPSIPDSSPTPQPVRSGVVAAIGTGVFLAALIATALLTVRGGWTALATVTGAALIGFALIWHRILRSPTLRPARFLLPGITALGIAAGFALPLGLYGEQVSTGECTPGYIPCVPIAESVTCTDLRMAVRIIGDDVYSLDRDGDGIGCESYAR